MADLSSMKASEMTEDQLREAIALAFPHAMARAARRWSFSGRPPDVHPEDIVQDAIASLLALDKLPDCPVGAYLARKILNLMGNKVRARTMAVEREGDPRLDWRVPSSPPGPQFRSTSTRVLGWLRGESGASDNKVLAAETEKVLQAWEAGYETEGDIAMLSDLTVDGVRAAKKRIARLLMDLPQYLADAVNDELGRT
jgi:hypothetical protein